MKRVLRTTLALSLVAAVLTIPAVGAQAAGGPQLRVASGGIRGPISEVAARAMRHGPLSNDPATLKQQKALAMAQAGQDAPQPLAVTPTPTILLKKNGIRDTTGSPSDSTGAIGTTRYIETVNSKVGIYNTSLSLLNSDTLNNFWGEAGANVFDPQIMWDATTNRFYYTGDVVFSSIDNRLAFGFSKTASPSNATTDWCHYDITYGTDFPDYPKLGDSQDFAIIGVNTFNAAGLFVGSDILALGKPPAGTSCPSTLPFGISRGINIGGTSYFTPVPATEVDANGTGWIVSRPLSLPATQIGLFKVTKDASGNPVFPAGTALTVPSYNVPANAPQNGTSFVLDTLDARMTQAVAAIDPGHSGKFAVWTQHAIGGGAGSKERWYEIDPVGVALLQSGDVSHSSLYYFNGAISPDRVVKGATSAFGQNMLLSFNASSSSTFPSIRMVAKRGANTVSGVKTVKTSPAPDTDFTCSAVDPCRWGDYSAATPDPNAPTTGAAGIVWSTSMWTKAGTGVTWQTLNWKSQP